MSPKTPDPGTKKPRGRLRVSAPSLFSTLVMGRIAAGFVAAYPDARLEVSWIARWT